MGKVKPEDIIEALNGLNHETWHTVFFKDASVKRSSLEKYED